MFQLQNIFRVDNILSISRASSSQRCVPGKVPCNQSDCTEKLQNCHYRLPSAPWSSLAPEVQFKQCGILPTAFYQFFKTTLDIGICARLICPSLCRLFVFQT